MGNLFIVNTPMMFSGVWRIAKGFIDERTRKKIEIKGKTYLPTLLEYADAENLPEFLGGSCTLPFPSDAGPWSNYELVNNKLVKKGSQSIVSNEDEELTAEKREEVNELADSKPAQTRISLASRDSLFDAARSAAGTIYYDCVEDEEVK